MQVITRVPAKINPVLSVGPARRDGYHDLATVFHAVSLYDEVRARAGDDLTVTMSGPYAGGVPSDATNLATRAARALAKRAGVPAKARVDVHKAIPVAAGLAGGSADAAGVLRACDALWELGASDTELATVAATLGSDVPFALAGGTAVGTGRGERLRGITVGTTLHWVLAVASRGLSTPDVYRRLDELRSGVSVPEPAVGEAILTALAGGDPGAVAASLRNDMQEAAVALRPELADTLRAGREAGALGGIVSGSGPTCAFLARDGEHSGELAARLDASGTCAQVLQVTGPARTGD
ncbi:4-(cytidine 5'-diphospho)-2-C-methyl-D-erythritol kinase [Haloactinopolyspora alba]|uniref:4-(cytidine 5'-diphospho)-2-C-methyl-D-erythritol kinase n=1 Tax=Haloactinopolyspora alba TaxID=648780 RepID=UPI000D0D18ED